MATRRAPLFTIVSLVFGAIFFVVLFRTSQSSSVRQVRTDTDFTPAPDRTGPAPAAAKAASPAPARAGEAPLDLLEHRLLIPVAGVRASDLRDSFDEKRGARRHEALDILAPRGTPVLAVDDGVVRKLFDSVPGGLTLYEFDPSETYRYSYAHLDSFAEGMAEGKILKRGDRVGSVGTTGNAPKDTPHLHFTLARLGPDKKWWEGTPLNPYPVLTSGSSKP